MIRFVDAVKDIKKSIVAIGYFPNSKEVTITGSGFVITGDGKIVTCAHVYNQTPKEVINNLKVLVFLKEENKLEHYKWVSAKLLKKDDKNDAAILQLEDFKDTTIKPLELGDSETMEVGEEVYLIGYPYAAKLMNDGFGITSHLSKTVISNIKRDGLDPKYPRNWIFVDTINNPGNSGAPLIDVETNKVIGFMAIAFRNKSEVKGYENLDIREPMHIGGAKPINLVKELIKNN